MSGIHPVIMDNISLYEKKIPLIETFLVINFLNNTACKIPHRGI